MLTAALLLWCGAAGAQDRPGDLVDETPIVASGVRPVEDAELLVQARARCRPRAGDPFDRVGVPRGVGGQSVIGPDATGTVRHHADDEPVLGPAIWQRAGNAIGDYVFRVPEDGSPLCIGAERYATTGFAQLRRIVGAEGVRGKYLHFSARVATRRAGQVRFWLMAGDADNRRGRGGDTRDAPISGTHGWQQVDLVVGPVPDYADHVSYGFLLRGRGDAWLADPRLEVIDRAQARAVASLPISRLGSGSRR